MQVVTSETFPQAIKACVLTIGNFDGVHAGHRELFARVVAKARSAGLPAVAMTFDPHPVQVLFPEREFKRLFNSRDRTDCLRSLGIDVLVVEPFSRELSGRSPEWFVKHLLAETLRAQFLFVGFDFSFGQDRKGTTQTLQASCSQVGLGCEIVPPVKIDGEVVSSTKIRAFVQEGSMDRASRFLQRPFYLEGLVEKGAGRGRKIGFPTANLFTATQIYPRTGVYFTRAAVRGKTFSSLTNVGQNPTFEKGTRHPIQVETHILDFDEDIYGETLKVEFLHYARTEVKFPSVDKLIAQIQSDVEQARFFFRAEK